MQHCAAAGAISGEGEQGDDLSPVGGDCAESEEQQPRSTKSFQGVRHGDHSRGRRYFSRGDRQFSVSGRLQLGKALESGMTSSACICFPALLFAVDSSAVEVSDRDLTL